MTGTAFFRWIRIPLALLTAWGWVGFPPGSLAQPDPLGPQLLNRAMAHLEMEIAQDEELLQLASNITALKEIRQTLGDRLHGTKSLVQELAKTYPKEMAEVISSLEAVFQQEEEIVNTALKSERVQRQTRAALEQNISVKREAVVKIGAFLAGLGAPPGE